METQESGSTKWGKKILLLLNCVILSTGNCGGPLISRLYFLRGGSRIWFSSWLISAAWPIIVIPLAAAYFLRLRAEGRAAKLFFMTPKVFAATAAIGVLTGVDNFLYAYGMAKLPVSTSSLLIATQLAFTAGFAFLLVKQTFTAYSVNAIVLLTMGAGVLAFGAGSDRPAGESSKEYIIGFVTTLLAAGLYGLILPAIELMYKLAKQAITYTLVLEIQTVMSFFATIFATIGMIINKDFQFLRKAEDFEGLGASNNYQGPLRSSAEVRNSFATTRATSGDPKAKPRDATATFEPPGLGWRSPIKHSADVRTAPLARARSFETSLSVRGTFDEIANRRSGDQTGGLLS